MTFERRSRRVRKVFKFPKRSSTARLSTLSQKFANVLFDDFIWMGARFSGVATNGQRNHFRMGDDPQEASLNAAALIAGDRV